MLVSSSNIEFSSDVLIEYYVYMRSGLILLQSDWELFLESWFFQMKQIKILSSWIFQCNTSNVELFKEFNSMKWRDEKFQIEKTKIFCLFLPKDVNAWMFQNRWIKRLLWSELSPSWLKTHREISRFVSLSKSQLQKWILFFLLPSCNLFLFTINNLSIFICKLTKCQIKVQRCVFNLLNLSLIWISELIC